MELYLTIRSVSLRDQIHHTTFNTHTRDTRHISQRILIKTVYKFLTRLKPIYNIIFS